MSSTATELAPTARGNTEWWNAGMAAIQKLARPGRPPFEAYDVAKMIGEPYDTKHHWGNLLNAAASRGLIESVGHKPSSRPGRNGGVTAHWIGKRP